MDIRKTFIDLTSHTYPHGKGREDFDKRAKDIIDMLPDGVERDDYGNFYLQIGDPTVMFTSHLDTATSADTTVKHVWDGDMLKTDGNSILGADDKTGTTIMMYMIEKKVPGLYYFFLGEEVGCLGSKWLSKEAKKWKSFYNKEEITDEVEKERAEWYGKYLNKIDKCIAFDRKGYKSVISFQYSRTASDKFCDDLADKLNKVGEKIEGPKFEYETDPTGLYTDSAHFADFIPECTNLSVGYFDQHTKREKQDMAFLDKLCEACINLDWESLTVDRDPKKDSEYRSYGGYGGYYGHGWHDDDYYSSRYSSGTSTRSSRLNTNKNKDKYNTEYWYDDKYDHLSEFHYKNDKIVDVDLCQERVNFELELIAEVFQIMEVPFDELEWNGKELKVVTSFNTSKVDRTDLYEFLPELKYEEQLA